MVNYINTDSEHLKLNSNVSQAEFTYNLKISFIVQVVPLSLRSMTFFVINISDILLLHS